jgi:hypothetical protein
MPRSAQFAKDGKGLEILDVHASYLEDVIGADQDAFSLRLAAPMIDDRPGCHVVTTSLEKRSRRYPRTPDR